MWQISNPFTLFFALFSVGGFEGADGEKGPNIDPNGLEGNDGDKGPNIDPDG